MLVVTRYLKTNVNIRGVEDHYILTTATATKPTATTGTTETATSGKSVTTTRRTTITITVT